MAARAYLDYAATAPLRPEALDAMLPWMGLASDGSFGNASTLSTEGKRARNALEEARATVARCIGATPPEVVFTSGGTESNNALIAGLCEGVRNKQGVDKGGNLAISSAFEHHAVTEPLSRLRRAGWQTLLLKPTRQGFITPDSLAEAIAGAGARCTLVTLMAANNELGSVQPIAELAEVAHASGALFHTDAVQALGKLPFDAGRLGIDAASFSAHKVGGPKGVGAFYLRSLTPFSPQMLGGGQERKLRSGTANVAGAVGFAKALELATDELAAESLRLTALRDQMARALTAASPRISLTVSGVGVGTPGGASGVEPLNTSGVEVGGAAGAASAPNAVGTAASTAATVKDAPGAAAAPYAAAAGTPDAAATSPAGEWPAFLPNLISLLVDGFQSEDLILKLDGMGFVVSGGSACSTGSLEPSHVLLALGIGKRQAQGALRISLGHGTTAAEVEAFIEALLGIVG